MTDLEGWRFAAVVPSYGDSTYTPWVVGVKDEKDLDALEDLARIWNSKRKYSDDLGMADFIAEVVENDPRFLVLASALTDGSVILEVD